MTGTRSQNKPSATVPAPTQAEPGSGHTEATTTALRKHSPGTHKVRQVGEGAAGGPDFVLTCRHLHSSLKKIWRRKERHGHSKAWPSITCQLHGFIRDTPRTQGIQLNGNGAAPTAAPSVGRQNRPGIVSPGSCSWSSTGSGHALGVTLLNISEPIFPKSLGKANTIWAFYLFPASSFLPGFTEVPSCSTLACP